MYVIYSVISYINPRGILTEKKENKMTQQQIDKYFMSDIGRQCSELYSTEDDIVFIRLEEAEKHIKNMGFDDGNLWIWRPSDDFDNRFTAILAKNHIARQLKAVIHSGESISVSVIEECLYQIEEYIGTGNQPSVEDIINSKQNI